MGIVWELMRIKEYSWELDRKKKIFDGNKRNLMGFF
jgi:hypothetical protein